VNFVQTTISKKKLQRFASGEKLITTPKELLLILNGVVKTYTINEEGEIITFGYWTKDDLIGKSLSVVEPYFLECLTEVDVVTLSLSEWQKFSLAMIHHSQRLQQLMYLVRKYPIEDRFISTLNWLTVRFGYVVEQGKLIELRLTHQELAQLMGVTRVTVTKLINKLEKEGIIFRGKNKYLGLTNK
jgi:CRP-like cAMP-binding protein